MLGLRPHLIFIPTSDPHRTNGETEVRAGGVPCPAHTKDKVIELGFQLGASSFQSPALWMVLLVLSLGVGR